MSYISTFLAMICFTNFGKYMVQRTITDYKKLHNADFSAVVGPEFQGERLVERAEKHKFILIDWKS
ncbi:hypothetical protein COF64_00220 [Bacillus sp. AFS043905]|nr:hypothetical protein COF64_00220 [Bacillus sp. AFS043905]